MWLGPCTHHGDTLGALRAGDTAPVLIAIGAVCAKRGAAPFVGHVEPGTAEFRALAVVVVVARLTAVQR